VLLAYWATVTENIPRCAQQIESVQGTQSVTVRFVRDVMISEMHHLKGFTFWEFKLLQSTTKKTNTVYTM